MPDESIIVKFGADTSVLSRALRSVRSEVGKFRTTLNDSFKQGFSNFGALFTVAGIAKGIGALREMVDGIKDLADATGTTTQFSQAWGQMGDQFGDNAEGANKALEKFAVVLGEARSGSDSAAKKFSDLGVSLSGDTEDVIKRVADKIAAIKDPTQQAAIAMDLFGKSGQGIVGILNQGADGIDRFVKSAHVISDASLEAIDTADKELKAGMKRLQVVGAEIISGWARLWKAIGTASVMGGKIGSQTLKVDYSKAEAAEAAELLKTKQEVAKVEEKITEVRAKQAEFNEKNKSTEEQLKDALKESGQLAEQGLKAKSGSKEEAEVRLKYEKKALDIMELQKKLEKEKADASKKADEEKKKRLEEQKKQTDEIQKAAQDVDEKEHDLQLSKEDRSKFTLEELAKLNPRNLGGNLRNEVFDAREVQRLESEGKRLRDRGFFEDSQDAFNRADKLRAGMTDLQDKERFPFKSMEEGINKAEQHLAELLEKADGDGLNVQARMGK